MMEQRRSETMHENQEELSACPTFNSYSSDKLAEIASRVTDEFKKESKLSEENADDIQEEEGEDDFEFSLVLDDPEIFRDGQIRPIFPIFNRDLLYDDSEVGKRGCQSGKQSSDGQNEIQIPLKDLFLREREERDPPSTSSSEADELESIPPGTYCVWRPKVPESPNRCKKSNSTGSASKRWKFLDLLRRSNSDGKDSYVFLTPKVREEKSDKTQRSKLVLNQSSGKPKNAKGVAASSSSSAHEAFYVRNRAIKEGDRRKSYLPYRQDLVGFFASANGLGRTFAPPL